MPKSMAVVGQNLGLYLASTPLAIPAHALSDGNNFRVQNGNVNNYLLGHTAWNGIRLNGPVTMMDDFVLSDGTDRLVFGTPTDLYYWNGTVLRFITPIYSTGTAGTGGVSNTIVVGVGTLWLANAKVGDEISFGSAAQNDPAATWTVIDAVTDNTHITLHTAVTVAGGTAYTIRKKYTGSLTTHWDTETFLHAGVGGVDLWFATNGKDDIAKWDGSTAQVVAKTSWTGGMTLRARHLKRYSNMMIFGAITVNGTYLPTSLVNSDIGDPEATTGGLASQFLVHDEEDPILDLQRLGDNLAIYSARNVVMAQFLGDPFIFSFRKAISNRGPLGERLVATFADFHEFLAQDSQYRFDGASAQPVGKQVWPMLLPDFDPTRQSLALNFFDDKNSDLIWSLPLITDTTTSTNGIPTNSAYPEHYLEDVPQGVPVPISKRDWQFLSIVNYKQVSAITWASLAATLWTAFTVPWADPSFYAGTPITLVGDINGYIYQLGASQNANGSAMASFVTFGQRTLDGRSKALIRRVYPLMSNIGSIDFNMNIYLKVSDGDLGSATQLGPYPISTTIIPYFVSIFRRGRYFECKFQSPGPDNAYELVGYDTDITYGGPTP
jgi:hypothetical protein